MRPDVLAFWRVFQIFYEWNDLDRAVPPLMDCFHIAEELGWVGAAVFRQVSLARVHLAGGERDRARAAWQEAMRLLPQVAEASVAVWMGAQQARYWLGTGDLDAAGRWARESGLNLKDTFTRDSTPGPSEYLTLARVRIAQARNGSPEAQLDRVLRFLDQQGEHAETQGRVTDLIKILSLRALALQVRGDLDGAMEALERALTLAEPEGYVRTSIDEGAPMAELLQEAAARGIAPAYVAKLLAEGLTNREIAEALTVTVGTVKTHLNHIYGKLEVHNRTQAVARARELGLLGG